MNEVAISYSEKDLLAFFQQIRLLKAKELGDSNAKQSYKSKQGASFAERIGNFSRFLEKSMKSSETIKKHIEEDLNKFNANHEKVMSKEEVENELNRLFEIDKYGIAKLIFASSIILDNEYQYEYLDEGLSQASIVLYGSPETLGEIKEQLEENYRSLSLKPLSSFEKGALIGLAGLSLFISPFVAIASATIGAIAASNIIAKNREKFKEEFKNSSKEDNAFYLALELTYIQRIKDSVESDAFKEELDSILKHIEELKSDLDYFMFVEKENVSANKEKAILIHAFDKRLMKILGIEK